MNYYPLFRVRSWNNGVCWMSFYIHMVHSNMFCWMFVSLYATVACYLRVIRAWGQGRSISRFISLKVLPATSRRLTLPCEQINIPSNAAQIQKMNPEKRYTSLLVEIRLYQIWIMLFYTIFEKVFLYGKFMLMIPTHTLSRRPNSNRFDNIFLFFNDSLNFVPYGPIYNKLSLVNVMVWRRTDASVALEGWAFIFLAICPSMTVFALLADVKKGTFFPRKHA